MCKINYARNFHAEILDLYENGLPDGYSLGWAGFDPYFKILKGQLNILSGIPGSGKSEWMESILLNLAENYGWDGIIYSPENHPPEIYFQKLIAKRARMPFDKNHRDRMSKKEMFEAETFIDDHFQTISSDDEVYDLDQILYTIEQIKRPGTKLDIAVIDPWNELENHRPKGESETDFIGRSLMTIRRFARKHDMSFWIVCHPTKLKRDTKGQYPEPTMYDLSGSQHWYNKSDNAIIMHRSAEQKANNEICKAKVMKIKNRHYGKIGEHHFKFDTLTTGYNDHKLEENNVRIKGPWKGRSGNPGAHGWSAEAEINKG